MRPTRLLSYFLFAGILSGVYTFDLRKAWADAVPATPAVAPAGEAGGN